MKDKFSQFINHILIGLIKLYKSVLSPYIASSCRYTPSCSQYSMEALKRYGPLKGSYMALRRILRCTPFHRGGFDPVK